MIFWSLSSKSYSSETAIVFMVSGLVNASDHGDDLLLLWTYVNHLTM